MEFMANWWAFFGICLHVAMIVYICLTKSEEPAEATFWLLVVALIPVGGIVLFCFFGITRIERANWHIGGIKKALTDNKQHALSRELARIEKQSRAFFAMDCASSRHNRTLDRMFQTTQLLGGNSVELLHDGSSCYPRMLQDIRAAKRSVRLQSFIMTGDKVGMQIFEALEERARAGVDVKVLFDSFGSFKSYFSTGFRRLLFKKVPNFSIRAFSPLNLLTPWKFQLRNHRKLLVIDGRVAYSGGINIADENRRLPEVPKNRYIHDLHCRICGPAVSQFALSFFRDWGYTVRRKPTEFIVPGEFQEPEECGATVLRVVQSGPGDNYMGTRHLFFAAAALAEKSLTIVTPYLVPGSAYTEALCTAAARGVAIKVIVPHKNNHFYVDMAARNFYRTLLKSGVRIFEKRGFFSHTKALLVDNEWGFMGSSNCDSRSFRLNFELDFCFEGGDFMISMRRQLARELDESSEILLFQEEKISLVQRLLCNCCALLTPIL